MNFFNFKRKHWVMVGIFLIFNIALIIGFTIFIHRMHARVAEEHRASLVWTPTLSKEVKESLKDKILQNTVDAQKGTCLACEKKAQEGSGGKLTKEINNAEVR